MLHVIAGDRLHVSAEGGEGDEAELHDALRRLAAGGGGHLSVGAGRWTLEDEPLRLPNRCRLELSPATVLVRTGALRTMLSNAPDPDSPTGDARYEGPGGLVISGGIWDVNGVANPFHAFGMVFNHARDVTVRDLEIRNMPQWHAIETNSTYNVLIENCRFINGEGRPIRPEHSEAISLDLARVDLTTWGKEDDTHARHVRIVNNYCENYPTFVGCHTGHEVDEHADVVISGNTTSRISRWAVSLVNTSRVSIQGNVFSDVAGGVRIVPGATSRGVKPVSMIAISGNVIACRDDGAAVSLEGRADAEVTDVAVVGNVLRADGAGAIRQTHTRNCVILGNSGA